MMDIYMKEMREREREREREIRERERENKGVEKGDPERLKEIEGRKSSRDRERIKASD